MSASGPVDELVARIARDAASLRTAGMDTAPDARTRSYLERIADAARELQRHLETSTATPASSGELRHDMRNRLNRIAGPVQLLQRHADGAIGAQLEQLRELIDEVVAVIDGSGRRARPAAPLFARQRRVMTSPARILVAEDDAENRRFLVEVLTGDGHQVDVANDGVTALEQAQNSDLDLLLLDLGLPRTSGFEVLERLQAAGWQTPVIVVTGRRAVDDAVRCIVHGADDFLTKPIQIEILRARVNSCIEKMRLREREFAQLFPPRLARAFARRPSLIDELPSRHADVSVLFCDIRNFTATSERLGPDKTIRWLRGVMHEISELIIENEGVLVDFAGDEIMALWGAPDAVPDHATRACNTAVRILECLPQMSALWAPETGSETDLAIGVNSGRALVGHVGTARKTKYGALGDAVNIGSRVLGATAHVHTRLLISGATRAAIDPEWNRGVLRRLCTVRVKNLAQAVELHEVVPASLACAGDGLRPAYEAALAAFERGELAAAAALLGELRADHPADGPAAVLEARVAAALGDADSNFDPVWTLPAK